MLYHGPDSLDQTYIHGHNPGNQLLRAVLASAAPIIIIHARTWPDLPHLGSRISSERPNSILCTCRNGHYSSMFGLEHACSTLFNQSTIWHLISIFWLHILCPWWFVPTLQRFIFPIFDSQHGPPDLCHRSLSSNPPRAFLTDEMETLDVCGQEVCSAKRPSKV